MIIGTKAERQPANHIDLLELNESATQNRYGNVEMFVAERDNFSGQTRKPCEQYSDLVIIDFPSNSSRIVTGYMRFP